jgi:hypothetical protein
MRCARPDGILPRKIEEVSCSEGSGDFEGDAQNAGGKILKKELRKM